MAYLNKDEATKAFEIAIENLESGKYEEALISANKARQMDPELHDIKKLVTLLQSLVLSADAHITHYGILGVEETANEKEIVFAYRKLAVELNPNTNNFPKASQAFRRILEAMRVLSDDRLKYDNDLAVAREAKAAYSKGFAFDLGIHAIAAKFDALRGKALVVNPWPVADSEAKIVGIDAPERRGRFDGMISCSEFQAAVEALQGRDLLVDHEARTWEANFKAKFDQDIFVTRERRAIFNALDTSDGRISVSELRATLEALGCRDYLVDSEARDWEAEFKAKFDQDIFVTPERRASFNVLDTFDGMISSTELQAAFEVYDKEPQSTNHHPSEKRCVCSSDEGAGRGTKRTNMTQATLTHPMPKK